MSTTQIQVTPNKLNTDDAQLRVGYVLQNGAPPLNIISGPQLHVSSIVDGLKASGHRVRLAALQDGKTVLSDDMAEWQPARFKYAQSRLFRLIERPLRRIQNDLGLPYFGLFESLRFADACSTALEGFDILYERHGYMGFGGLFAARRLGMPLIIELNGNIIDEIDMMGLEMSPIQRRVGRWITRRTLNAADHIVVVSAALKEQIVENMDIAPSKVTVVTNGANTTLFSRPFDTKQVRTKHKIAAAPVVTFVGSFQPWHGVDLLVDAFALVRAHNPDAQLIIIGDGEGLRETVSHIERQDLTANVRLTGRLDQEEVAALLSVADVAVAPYPFRHSKIVGTPLKLVEYMAAGKAIVASTAQIHQLIEDGQTGIRVAPADANALADGIVRLLSDQPLRERLGENARRQAVENYSWASAVKQTICIMQSHLPR